MQDETHDGAASTASHAATDLCGCGHTRELHVGNDGDGLCAGTHPYREFAEECMCIRFWRKGPDGRRIWEPTEDAKAEGRS